MKVAILGGSFNPPHICHVFITHYVLTTSPIDQLWFLPCSQHAFGKSLAAFHHRMEMCALAVTSFRKPLVRVLPIEQERQGTSWTIDTIRYVKAQYPKYEFSWIIGADVLNELGKWKDFHELQQLISFIVIPRAGSLVRRSSRRQEHGVSAIHQGDDRILQELRQTCQKLEEQGVLFPNISSTLVRARVQQRQSIHQLVPQAVEEYIYAHHLYHTPDES